MPRILILDTYYPAVFEHIRKAWNAPTGTGGPATYSAALKDTLDLQFGTADFYSHALRNHGWEAEDVVVNFPELQRLWAKENSVGLHEAVHSQIQSFKPDILFLQDLGLYQREGLERYKGKMLIAGQSSCAIRRELIKHFNVLFTSFPHYVEQFSKSSCKWIYNPLAFDPRVLDSISHHSPRTIDISFVGGVGNPSHWSAGMNVLEAVARAFPEQFHWWGYGADNIPMNSALFLAHRGPAWGRQMYKIYADSKIVINRHGEVSNGYSNNMRMYEATGCGALLLTEASKNLNQLFDYSECLSYTSIDNAINAIEYVLKYASKYASEMAKMGQRRTLSEHTYENRMKLVSETLKEMMEEDTYEPHS